MKSLSSQSVLPPIGLLLGKISVQRKIKKDNNEIY